MYVCICNKVTDSQIREACRQGARSVDCLSRQLNLGTCCGRCRDCAREVMQQDRATEVPGGLGMATA